MVQTDKTGISVHPDPQDANPRLLAGNESDASINAGGGGMMFLPGLMESLPLGAGVLIGQAFDAEAYLVGGSLGGLLETILVCWLLRNKVPQTPIH